MSAVNPVFLLPGRLSEAAAELGAAFVGSLTLGAGQFCTNPGIVIGIDGPDLDRFTAAARDAVAASPAAPMLTGRIAAAYADGATRLADHPGTEVIALGADPGRENGRTSWGCAALVATTADEFLAARELHDEVFGATSVIVRAADPRQLIDVARAMEGQLTATVHAATAGRAAGARPAPGARAAGGPDPVQRLADRGRGGALDGARRPVPCHLRQPHDLGRHAGDGPVPAAGGLSGRARRTAARRGPRSPTPTGCSASSTAPTPGTDAMSRASIRITGVAITPVAFADPPLLNSVGVHEPFALRAIIEVATDAGLTGLGETYADEKHLAALHAAAAAIVGADVYQTEDVYRRVQAIGAAETTISSGLIGHSAATDRVFSPFEVACLDIQGKAAGLPVADLLGGAVRDAVPFSAYLFYKWAGHPGADGDDWGEALDPDGIVAQAKRLVDGYGFTALKLKGGVFPPAEEIEAISALHDAFPDHPLRLDPNAAWTPETSIGVARALAGVLEYLEDPTPGIEGMAQVAREAAMPLATNMCVVAFDHLPPAIRRDAVQVILSDHHYWGGLRRSKLLAGICETFGLGLSMHSNSHLGISLAAMVQLAGAVPNLTYACDTHWPWKTEDVVAGEPFSFSGGAIAVPDRPGLGVELDRDALGRLHEQYLACGLRNRDDTGYMQRIVPGYERRSPRW